MTTLLLADREVKRFEAERISGRPQPKPTHLKYFPEICARVLSFEQQASVANVEINTLEEMPAVKLSSAVFPRAAAYVDSLPHGLETSPECRIKTNAHEATLAAFPKGSCPPGAPPILRALLEGTYHDIWIPEVVGNTLILMLRDIVFKTDEELFAWSREGYGALFTKPMYKLLMYVLSPTLLVLGISRRWGAFHEGSELTAAKAEEADGRLERSVTLTYPPHVYNGLLLERVALSFSTALEAARAVEIRSVLRSWDPTKAEFVIGWNK